MKNFYSNGKLLLTGEYLVLDGAKSLAIPTKFGQNLAVKKIKEPQIIWESFTHRGECWFKAIFKLPKLRLLTCTFTSKREENAEFIAETLLTILEQAKKLNPSFLKKEQGFMVKTNLTFPRNWGLGSSSTLINSIAHWAKVDAFQLLWNSFSGSGYDIACAQNDSPVFYQLKNKKPIVEKTDFNPTFKNNLFFVYLNKKQNSRKGIALYKKYFNSSQNNTLKQIELISNLTDEFLKVKSLSCFDKLIVEHEQIISSIIQINPIKKTLFSDYFGQIKSLGAWGGDFALATGDKTSPEYFKNKGFQTILSYSEMIL